MNTFRDIRKREDNLIGPHYGIIAVDASDPDELLPVVLPDFDDRETWGPCRWPVRDSNLLPQAGDECLVVFDNRRDPWISAWWPKVPFDPDEDEQGWTSLAGVFTYNSWDASVYTGVVNTPADFTGILQPAHRVKLMQSGVPIYGIVTKITAGQLTIFFGTDYTLSNVTITQPAFSREKCPFGFPVNPAKWTVTVNTNTSDAQAAPVNGTWYNPNARQLSVPIGCWKISLKAMLQLDDSAGAVDLAGFIALSTVNNGMSDSELAFAMRVVSAGTVHAMAVQVEGDATVTVKTPYYLVIMAAISGTITSIGTIGAYLPTILQAECAYL